MQSRSIFTDLERTLEWFTFDHTLIEPWKCVVRFEVFSEKFRIGQHERTRPVEHSGRETNRSSEL